MSSDHDVGVVVGRVASDLRYAYSQVLLPGALGNAKDLVTEFYYDLDPFSSALLICLTVALLSYGISVVARNQGVVDRLWSLLPLCYTWHFLWRGHLRNAQGQVVLDPRLALITLLVTTWSCRLTYNFWRKGGYSLKAEDYRWEVVRGGGSFVPPVLFPVFNLLFIALYQNLLLLFITLPIYASWRHAGTPLNRVDALATVLAAAFLVVEAVADQQQWVFQTQKHARKAAGKRLTGDYNRGFITSGLWAFSRHPNFFAEQGFWAAMYLFGVASSGAWLHWSGLGAVQLIALFSGSTGLTERITQQKYPKYKAYQATVSRLIPWVPAKPKRR